MPIRKQNWGTQMAGLSGADPKLGEVKAATSRSGGI